MSKAARAAKANGYIAGLIAAQPKGHALNQDFYADPAVFAVDAERVFMRDWLYVGHVSQVPAAGDFFVFAIAGESVIVVRGGDGEIRALVNVCRHRGSRVCMEKRGSTQWFYCPYHGWTYDLEGNLAAARRMPKDFDKSAHGLKRIHAAVFHGFILINFADAPASLDAAHRDLDDKLAPFALERAKVAHSESYTIAANWKLALENYQECYHCTPAHPEFAESHSIQQPDARNSKLMEALKVRAKEAGVSTAVVDHHGAKAGKAGFQYSYDRYPLYPGFETGSQVGAPVAPLMFDVSSLDGVASDLQLGALTYFLFYSDHGVVYRFTPHDVQSTECEIVWLVRDDAEEGRDYDVERLKWLWDVTTVKDKMIIENNQAGVNSRFYQPGPYAPMEHWCARFIDWYLEQIG